ASSQAPSAARHTVVSGWKTSAGQAALAPSQISATSHAPAAARHTVPAFPAGCWQVSLAPSQVSVVHGLPSSVQAVPFACFASAGHEALEPVQVSATSQAPAAARHTVVAGWKASAGQAALVPSQRAATAQTPAAARHAVPGFPAGCWHVPLAPSHWSRVQGLPSDGHEVPAGAFASAGQLIPVPVHVSCGSHGPADARHTTVAGWKASAGQVVLV